MMGHKLLFSIILYAAGFITAVYYLAPSPVQAADQSQIERTEMQSQDLHVTTDQAETRSNEVWMIKVRTGIDTCIRIAEEQALQAADLIRSKMGQGQNQSDQ